MCFLCNKIGCEFFNGKKKRRRRVAQKWGNLKNSIYHPLRKHYEYFSYVKSLNHDLRVPLKGRGRISPHPSDRKCGRSSMDDDRSTRIAGITFDLGRVPVAFVKPRHVSRIRGWCSLERGIARALEIKRNGARDEMCPIFFYTYVYNGVRVKRNVSFLFLLN